eukprot:scaffold672989_cov67-Prasinocladus_malaysianus.AAC.1
MKGLRSGHLSFLWVFRHQQQLRCLAGSDLIASLSALISPELWRRCLCLKGFLPGHNAAGAAARGDVQISAGHPGGRGQRCTARRHRTRRISRRQ